MDEFRLIGRFNQFKYPETAIMLLATNYMFIYPVPSVTLPDTCIDKIGMYCPDCNNTMEMPNHGDAYECNICLLKVQKFGNALYTWR